MISSFFNQTKPVNYLVLSLGFLVFFLAYHLIPFNPELLGQEWISWLGVLFAIVFQGAVINNIVVKTRITLQTTFALMVFAVLLIGFLDLVLNVRVVWANFFLILAINELLQMDPSKKLNLEIFNATFWIALATLFVPMTLFFIPTVFVGIFTLSSNKLKNWLLPLAALAAFFLIVFALMLFLNNQNDWLQSYQMGMQIGFQKIDWTNYTRLLLYALSVSVVFLLIFLKSSASGGFKILKLRFLLLFFIMAMAITFLSIAKDYGLQLVLFSFCPAAFLITNYFELVDLKRFREPILAIGIAIPLTFAIYRMFA